MAKWTKRELKIVSDTMDMDVEKVAELLPGRTEAAIVTKRSYFRKGEGERFVSYYNQPKVRSDYLLSDAAIEALYKPHGGEVAYYRPARLSGKTIMQTEKRHG